MGNMLFYYKTSTRALKAHVYVLDDYCGSFYFFDSSYCHEFLGETFQFFYTGCHRDYLKDFVFFDVLLLC